MTSHTAELEYIWLDRHIQRYWCDWI